MAAVFLPGQGLAEAQQGRGATWTVLKSVLGSLPARVREPPTGGNRLRRPLPTKTVGFRVWVKLPSSLAVKRDSPNVRFGEKLAALPLSLLTYRPSTSEVRLAVLQEKATSKRQGLSIQPPADRESSSCPFDSATAERSFGGQGAVGEAGGGWLKRPGTRCGPRP